MKTTKDFIKEYTGAKMDEFDKCRAGYTPPTEKEMEKEILESNPVLKETNFQSKMDKWNKLKAKADKKGLTADQSAKYIADRM